MALQTEIGVARNQHFFVWGAMRVVAGCATFPHGLMLENKRASLRLVALHAGVGLGSQGSSPAFDGLAFMRVVAIRAGDFAVFHRMMMGIGETRLHIHVTLKACFGITLGVYDRVARPATFVVNAPRAVARFTADCFRVWPHRFEPLVGGCMKILRHVFVTLLAGLVSNECRRTK
jgi:hypothetical protein